MTQIKNPMTIILIALFFTITTCTTDNTVTGNSNQSLGKTTGIVDISSPASDDDEELTPTQLYINRLIGWIMQQIVRLQSIGGLSQCMSATWDGNEYIPDESKSYDFRDDYLSNTEKGNVYIACYYLLSEYTIKNNIIGRYYKEHFELLHLSTEIAYDLQHSSDNEQILVNKEFSKKLKDMLKIYREHPNHREIEPVLDYLEMDLVKYENQPKSKIAADFK